MSWLLWQLFDSQIGHGHDANWIAKAWKDARAALRQLREWAVTGWTDAPWRSHECSTMTSEAQRRTKPVVGRLQLCHRPMAARGLAEQPCRSEKWCKGFEEEPQEPQCIYCGRMPADFAGGLAGLRSHVPQCRKRPRS